MHDFECCSSAHGVMPTSVVSGTGVATGAAAAAPDHAWMSGQNYSMMKCVYANKWYHIICVDTTVDLNSSICKPSFAIFRGDLKLNISLNLSISFTPPPKEKRWKKFPMNSEKNFRGVSCWNPGGLCNQQSPHGPFDRQSYDVYMILIFWCKDTHSEDSIWTLTSDKTLVISGSNHEVIEQTASIDTTEPSMSISKQRGVKSTNTLGP